MRITRKITAVALAAGIAFSGASVATAQSSSLFGNLSSSRTSPAESTPTIDTLREEIKQVYVEWIESVGLTYSEEHADSAQEVADALATGESSPQDFRGNDEWGDNRFDVSLIPNVLLGAYIEEVGMRNSISYRDSGDFGVAVSGTEHITYVVMHIDSSY